MNDPQSWRLRMNRLLEKLTSTLVVDHHRLQRRRRQIEGQRRPDSFPFAALDRLEEQLDQSVARYHKRLAEIPVPRYTLSLPINENREKIMRLIHDNQVIVICSETGSGKTTQLPKLCLELKRGARGFIGMTQPRRLAARSLATYLSRELGSDPGTWVGYKMRFDDQVRETSLVKIMTDGLLLAELQSDPLLLHYDTLIIDEAHERSLNIDFLLGYLKKILPRHPDLKVIVSSATLDHEKFSAHFGKAPVLSIPGRTHPVEVRHVALTADDDPDNERDLPTAVLESIRQLHRSQGPGDILVFLPGEGEIKEMALFLRQHLAGGHEIIPVHARLAARDQDRIFSPGILPRIILATNVAETSITVPGIRHVIDPGKAKIKRQDHRGGIQRLSLEKISRASAEQRKGRCGRTGPGICIRLYSEDDFLARPPFTDPEILRTSLAATILGMKAQGLGNIEEFPFMDPPSPAAIREGWRLLGELGAVDRHGQLTTIGKQLARLPIDPRLGRMILSAPSFDCLEEILVIAAALAIPDPREWPMKKLPQAEELHQRFIDKDSDFLTFLNLWRYLEQVRHTSASRSRMNNTLKKEFIAPGRVREWWEVYAQLRKITREMGLIGGTLGQSRHAAIHKAILSGHVSMVGMKKMKNEFSGCREVTFHIHPGSGLFRKSPPWIVAAELVATSRLYARTCARIEPEWIEEVAKSACKRDYYEAQWDNRQGKVIALEKVSFGGLPLVMNRKIHFGPIDPVLSRRIFIQEALVGHRLQTKATFLAHNRALIHEIRQEEHKARRRDLLIEEGELFALYDRHIPATTYSARHFDNWYVHAQKNDPRLLHFTRQELLRHPDQPGLQEQFPGHLSINGQDFSLEYHFNPGSGEDGLSVRIPLAALHQCPTHPFEWLVPGMLPGKLAAMFKALPKNIRKQLVPVPETVQMCLPHLMELTGQPLANALSRVLKEHRGIDIAPILWRTLVLPDHLRMNFMVLGDGDGKVVQQGRDLESLRTLLGPQAKKEFSALAKPGIEQEGLTRWTFGALPESVSISTPAGTIIGFPTLVDQGNSVSLRIMEDPERARITLRRGLIRLFALHLPQQVRQLRSTLKFSPGAVLVPLPLGKQGALVDEVIDRILDRVFLQGDSEFPRDREPFQERLQTGQKRIFQEAETIRTLMEEIHNHYRMLQLLMKTEKSLPATAAIIAELRGQLEGLIYPGFLWETPFSWLREYPRYLKAMHKRLERRMLSPTKDAEKAAAVRPFQESLRLALSRGGRLDDDPELMRFRWMVEEFRVSQFAQELGTALPVSPKRLEEQWRRVAS
ncbi:MAG: ATP-dependent RNA helicase HrpA [Magnetococcales bacterium]|nr:ATP-dependent RNA helicase HrpA [Magnetococcales bacterium]